MKTLVDYVIEALQGDEWLIVDGKLAKNKIVELALNLDPALIKLLLSKEKLENHFFTDIEGVLIFDKVAFQRFINNNSFLPDSYTEYKNKIGLAENNHYVSDSNDIVLAWPYKDCILEAPEQVDSLLAPKVLTNFKKYDSDGEHKDFSLTRDDNLIVKGNNLLALYSLMSVYRGKVDLIYIDPPFNTEHDSFLYNDKFNRSTWLTFMKNRLEAAKALLSDTGTIYVHIDHNEGHYLKVLMDEIFGRDNFRNEIIWR